MATTNFYLSLVARVCWAHYLWLAVRWLRSSESVCPTLTRPDVATKERIPKKETLWWSLTTALTRTSLGPNKGWPDEAAHTIRSWALLNVSCSGMGDHAEDPVLSKIGPWGRWQAKTIAPFMLIGFFFGWHMLSVSTSWVIGKITRCNSFENALAGSDHNYWLTDWLIDRQRLL